MNRIQLVDDGSFNSITFDKVPFSSIYKVTKENFRNSLDVLSGRPLLTDKWFVLLDSKLTVQQVAKIFSFGRNYNLLNLKFSDQDLFDELKKLKCDFSIVDNITYSKSEVKSYIMSELNISDKLAGSIGSKCNWYYKFVSEEVSKLKFLDEVTAKDINRYVVQRTNINNYSLLYHLLKFKPKSPTAISNYLYKHRMHYKFLREALVAILDQYLYLYDKIGDGVVGSDNLQDVELDDFKLSRYQLKMVVLDMHKVISYSNLLELSIYIKKTTSVMDLLILV